MSKIAAKRMQICIFTLGDQDYDAQPEKNRAAFDAFAQVSIQLQEQHGGKAPIELDFCPLKFDENVQIVNQNGLDYSRLPAVQVYAEYPDGTAKFYFLKTGLGGLSEFTPEKVAPYVKTLLYNLGPSQQPVICKIFPLACEIGAWLWLTAFAITAYKTTQARNVGKFIWGAAALASGEAFLKGGGLDKLKNLVK